MGVMDAIRRRKSIRAFLPKPVEDEKLEAVLEAGRLAPSAHNRQEWRYIIVRDAALRAKVGEAANNQKHVAEAPVIIVGCAETDGHLMKCGEPCYTIDVAISMDHMSLAAAELGLGTCWIGAFDQPAVKKILGIPESVRVVQLMPLGYPAIDPAPKPRITMNEMVKYDRW